MERPLLFPDPMAPKMSAMTRTPQPHVRRHPVLSRSFGFLRFALGALVLFCTPFPGAAAQPTDDSVAERFDVRVFGYPIAGRPFIIQLVETGTPTQDRNQLTFEASGDSAQIEPIPDSQTSAARITPSRTGRFEVRVSWNEEDVTHAQLIEFVAASNYTVYYEGGGNTRTLELEPVGDNLFRRWFRAVVPVTFEKFALMRDGQAIEFVESAQLPPGFYAIEVQGDKVRQHTIMELATVPSFMVPGYWHRFELPPGIAHRSAAITGDFNNWVDPKSEHAIRLMPQADGTWLAIEPFPPGAHRFCYVIDGDRWIPDPNPDDQERTGRATRLDGVECSILLAGPRVSDFPAPQNEHITLEALSHNHLLERDLRWVCPNEGVVDLSFSVLPGDAEGAYLQAVRMPNPNERHELRLPMQLTDDPLGFDRFALRIRAGGPEFTYRFILRDGQTVRSSRAITATATSRAPFPNWAFSALRYRIEIDRFRNARTANDPPPGPSTLMKWGADPAPIGDSEARDWIERTGDRSDGVMPNPSLIRLHRRYGGDLQGIVEKLDHIASIGASIIELSPPFVSDPVNTDAVIDFRHIDPSFAIAAAPPEAADSLRTDGALTPSDTYFIKDFLPEAHAKGIRVVLRVPVDRVSAGFIATHAESAPAPHEEANSWFVRSVQRDPRPGETVDVRLDRSVDPPGYPEGLVLHLAYSLDHWLRHGVDGIVLVTHHEETSHSARLLQRLLRTAHPNALIELDHAHQNEALLDWVAGKDTYDLERLPRELANLRSESPVDQLAGRWTLGPPHSSRVIDSLRAARSGMSPQQPWSDIEACAKLAFTLLATLPGSPVLQYGDEFGMRSEPPNDERGPVPWPDLPPMERESDRLPVGFLSDIRPWLELRTKPEMRPVIAYGSFEQLPIREQGAIAYSRSLNGTTLVVVINRGDSPINAAGVLPGQSTEAIVPPLNARFWIFDF